MNQWRKDLKLPFYSPPIKDIENVKLESIAPEESVWSIPPDQNPLDDLIEAYNRLKKIENLQQRLQDRYELLTLTRFVMPPPNFERQRRSASITRKYQAMQQKAEHFRMIGKIAHAEKFERASKKYRQNNEEEIRLDENITRLHTRYCAIRYTPTRVVPLGLIHTY